MIYFLGHRDPPPSSADPVRCLGTHLAATRVAGICVSLNPTFKQEAEYFNRRQEKK